MEEERRNLAFHEAVDFAMDQEEATIELYGGYLASTTNQGLKQLLRSIISQEKDHVKRLAELKKAGDLSGLLEADGNLEVSVDAPPVPEEAAFGTPSARYLSLVIERERLAAELYRTLGAKAANPELSFLFRRLSDEELKHKAMAQNRYELEELSRS
jgi:rubrerythrin